MNLLTCKTRRVFLQSSTIIYNSLGSDIRFSTDISRSIKNSRALSSVHAYYTRHFILGSNYRVSLSLSHRGTLSKFDRDNPEISTDEDSVPRGSTCRKRRSPFAGDRTIFRARLTEPLPRNASETRFA